MRKMILAAAFAVLVLCTGSAMAGSESYFATHTVVKGNTLWGVSHKYLGTGKQFDVIAKANNISDPRKLRIGTVLLIPVVPTIHIHNHNTAPFGAKAVQGDLKVLWAIDNVSGVNYMPEMKDALKQVVSERNPSPYILMKGEKADCYSDKSSAQYGMYCPPNGFEYDWDKIGTLRADSWSAKTDNMTCLVRVIEACGNVDTWCWEIEIPPPPPAEEVPAPPIPAPPEPILPPVGEEKIPPVEKPAIKLPLPEKKPAFKWPEAGCCPPEHEPIIGAGIWGNGIAQGNWYYAEYMAWLKANCDSEYSYGVGFYLNGEDGNSKLSAYEWWGFGAGPQLGIKRYWFYSDNTVGDDKERPQQWSVKARLIWETIHGSNPESGYMNRQNDLKAGIYAEYVRQMSDRWQGSLTGEGWYNFNRRLTTTWKGDTPSNRTQISLGAFAQYKLNDTWQVRFGGGPFYQGWDHLTGLHARAELRYKEVLMFGPYVNLFPWKTSVYEGIPLAKLQTVGAFVRVEFGPIIRDLDERRRRERVQRFKWDPAREVALASTAMASAEESAPSDVSRIEGSAEVDVDKIAEPVIVVSQAERDEYDRLDRKTWPAVE